MKTDAIIAFLGGLVPLINNLVGWFNRTVETLKQDTELTEGQSKALDDYIDAIDRPVWWKHE